MIKAEKYCKSCNKKTEKEFKFKCQIKAFLKCEYCHSCSHKNRWKNFSEEQKNAIRTTLDKNGKNKPFLGRKHSEESKQKVSKSNTGKIRSEECKKHISNYMTLNNPRSGGKNNYDLWIEKYGKEEADRRQSVFLKKQHEASSGSNNPMYGKPTPNGAGNGWKGWYKDIFFRSLLELAYLHYLFENSIEFQNGELIRIPYINYDGSEHTYAPDYIIGKELIEVKPERLIKSSRLVKLKKEAAEKWCSENGYSYKLITPEKLPLETIIRLIDTGEVRFTDKTNIRFKQYLGD